MLPTWTASWRTSGARDRPQLAAKTIFVSGWVKSPELRYLVSIGSFLAKPFSVEELRVARSSPATTGER
jgi:hypothetical protein